MRTNWMVTATVATAMLAGCATGGDDEWSPDEAALTTSEQVLADAVVAYVNAAAAGDLSQVVSASAARSIVAARPFDSLAQLAATSYVGNAALHALLSHVAPDDVLAGAGFWDKTLLSSDQASTVLEMANTLDLTAFGCDLGLAGVGQRVVAARPLATMQALADVPYVGASQLERFKKHIAWFATADETKSRLDCVAFSDAEKAAALQFANEAGFGQLCAAAHCGFGTWITNANLLIAARPWRSLEVISGTRGFGPASMSALRRGGREVLAGMSLGTDSVRRVLAGEVHGEWAQLGPTQTLVPSVHVGQRYVPGTGYLLSDCRRIADVGESDTATYSALSCTAGCSRMTRFWKAHDLGLVFYTGTHCSIDGP